MAREHYQAFVDATEVSAVSSSFQALLNSIEAASLEGLEVLEQVKSTVGEELGFRQGKIFDILDKALEKRQSYSSNLKGNGSTRVFISGAGPCGLRCAVECALLGFHVTIVEKRKTFSRANILLLWPQTKDDLIALGAKYFYSQMLTSGHPLHLGTREIQLCLLKTALLLGVQVHYETELVGLTFDQNSHMWCAQTMKGAKKVAKDAESAALEFKPNKMGDYQTTFKCNAVDKADLDSEWISKRVEGADIHPFHACVIAEGEWSQSSRKLGFQKQVDRFSQAIGVVVNLKYNKSNKEEQQMQSFSDTSMYAKSKMVTALADQGIDVENVGYLKGRTHYIAISLSKKALLANNVLKQDLPSSELLTEENLNLDMLKKLAKSTSKVIGLPESVDFYDKNPVQVFDFSSRARATVPARILTTETTSGSPSSFEVLPGDIQDIDKQPLAARAHIAPVFVIGDALLEPFWPQGLGSNRGFHGCIDTAFAILKLEEGGVEACFNERQFAYQTMLSHSWWTGAVNKFKFWTVDPATRYAPRLLEGGRKLMLHKKAPLPTRWMDESLITEMKKKMKAPSNPFAEALTT